VKAFTFVRPDSVAGAVETARVPERRFVAGGTTLIDLMKLEVETPEAVIDINRLPLTAIARTPDGGLRIGALARNADVANHPNVEHDYPVLAQALLAGASAQLRNMASTAGNLLQRTRCVYFRDIAMPCNKREPGSGCAAIGGYNRNLAILGVSERCIATNPSDQNVALSALEATIEIAGGAGMRSVAIGDFFLKPGETPQIETILQPGELITAVVLPPPPPGARSTYLKLRDRASYEFALTSAAVVATVADGKVSRIRIAMGGIGTVPWRCAEAESLLTGRPATRKQFEQAAGVVVRDATPQSENSFKIELARRCLVHALNTVTTAA
jgi:xanthine dehydrogenase YagS FAD-binding subunit